MTASAPKKRTCARCGHHGWPAASFPEGHLCYPCLDAALSATGTCPGCGTADRALPGLRDGVRICRDCAGITRDFSCLRCGTETGMAPGSRRGLRRLCGRCAVAWTAARLLEDGTGAIAAPLKPLADALAATASPSATLEWLRKPHICDLLTRLAAGTLPLTHEALDGWPRRRAVHYLRDLLVDCGVLPAADRQLREFGTWLDRRLDALAGHPQLRLLRQFGLWHQLPAMRARAAAGPLRTTAAQYARSRFIQAQAFLTWAAGLGEGGRPPSPRRTSTRTTPATAPTSAKAPARSWSGRQGTATSPATWTSPASSPTPGRPSPSSAAWICCAASPPAPIFPSSPAQQRA